MYVSDHVVKESLLTLSRDSFVLVSRVALGNHDQTLYLSVSSAGQVDVANAVNILPMKFDPSWDCHNKKFLYIWMLLRCL